ncbi:hypothetical protein CYLTODRAFT_417966 [Cylindrobasidium torrendii FP15055 ss-10]|uniref:Uncharacterized protein n=1 Tax=Cylindrobasidium torrendii FP15055 ss-10 TaxID=1314674 RepID=A0A0D7BRZ6_9AGAR|nr:hypothetical protein CYLTODRAFT_417966 [Cylindrobasidium torrendii FP15055 ss-10]
MDSLPVENGHANGLIDPILQENGADVAPSKAEELVTARARVEDADKTGDALVDVEAETPHPQLISEDQKTPNELKELAKKIPNAPIVGEEPDLTLMDALLPASAMNSGDSLKASSDEIEINEADPAPVSAPSADALPILEDATSKVPEDVLVDDAVPEANASAPGAVEDSENVSLVEVPSSAAAQTPVVIPDAIEVVEAETSPEDPASIGTADDLAADIEPTEDVVATPRVHLEEEVNDPKTLEEPSNEVAPADIVAESPSVPDVQPIDESSVTPEDSAAFEAKEDAVETFAEDKIPATDAAAIVGEAPVETLTTPSYEEPVVEEAEEIPAGFPEPEAAASAEQSEVQPGEDVTVQEMASDLVEPIVDEVDSVPTTLEAESEPIAAQPLEEQEEHSEEVAETDADVLPVDTTVDSLIDADTVTPSKPVEELSEQPAVAEEPAVEELFEEPAEKTIDVVPAVEESIEEPSVEEAVEQPTAEMSLDEYPNSQTSEASVEEPAITESDNGPVIEETVEPSDASEEQPAVESSAVEETVEQAIEETVLPVSEEETAPPAIEETVEVPAEEKEVTVDEQEISLDEQEVAAEKAMEDLPAVAAAPVEEIAAPPSSDETVAAVEEHAPVTLASPEEHDVVTEASFDDGTVPSLAEEATSLEDILTVDEPALVANDVDAPIEPVIADQIEEDQAEEASLPAVEEAPVATEETVEDVAPAIVEDAVDVDVPSNADISIPPAEVASEDADVSVESSEEDSLSSTADEIPAVAVEATSSLEESIDTAEEPATEPSQDPTPPNAPEEVEEAQAGSEPHEDVASPSEPVIDVAPLIVEPVDATPIDTASLGPASPIERPKSPWTPSYSVTSQGPGLTPEDEIPAIDDAVLEETPASQTLEAAPTTASTLAVSDAPAEVPRPTSPWTPSYSTSVQGSPAVYPTEPEEIVPSIPAESVALIAEVESAVEASVEQIIESAPSTEEDTPSVLEKDDVAQDAPAPTVEITEPAAVDDDIVVEPPVAEETLAIPTVAIQDSTESPAPVSERPPSPWTPSYSISQQGNRSSDNLLADAARSDVETVESAEVPGSGSFIDESAPTAQPELPRPTSPWTPSYSVSHLGTEETEPVSVDNSEDAIPEPADDKAESSASPIVVVEDTSSEEPAASDAPAADIERPWTPSYSVTQQGSASPAPGEPAALEETDPAGSQPEDDQEDEEEDDGDAKSLSAIIAPIAALTAATAGSNPASPLNQPSDLIEEKEEEGDSDAKGLSAIVPPIAALATAVASPDQLATPSEIERPWTPSYSVTSQGPGSPLPPPPSELPVLKSEEPVESKLEVPALSAPRPASPSWTPSYSVSSLGPSSPAVSAKEFLSSDSREAVDTLEPLPSPSGLSFPRDDDLTSLDTLSSLPESRKRVESSVSSVSSKYFPGGWFSRPSLVTETRRSLESAAGEFTPITPSKTETESLPATEATDAAESVEDDGSSTNSDESDESEDKKKRGSWCVVM